MEISQIGAAGNWADAQSVAHTGSHRSDVRPATPVITSTAVQQPAQASAQMPTQEALQSINKTLQSMSSRLQFSLDEESNRTIVKVVDQETDQVIRQIPTEEAIEISKALDKLQGLLIHAQA